MCVCASSSLAFFLTRVAFTARHPGKWCTCIPIESWGCKIITMYTIHDRALDTGATTEAFVNDIALD